MKPAVDSARRLVVRPVDIAYVKRGNRPSGDAPPSLFVLGKDGAKLFLRFSVHLPPAANIVEAYVVLHRAHVVDDDPAPVSLHATRIVAPWSGGSMSWAEQPAWKESRSPSTVVEPGGTTLVRLDVREFVRHWRRHDPTDQGIAILAENETPTGTTFALTAMGADSVDTARLVRSGLTSGGTAPDVEPYL
ncbi:MAG TPA: DNRLRE domain-containing protein, partial [Labilithrix sp.]|nr:DNRLRE domain-containing protein [Labilithrix sp.]